MSAELQPKILEYRVVEVDTPELILDFHLTDPSLNFASVAGAMEEIVGVYYVTLNIVGSTMKVVLRNDSKTLNNVRSLVERGVGYRPYPRWEPL